MFISAYIHHFLFIWKLLNTQNIIFKWHALSQQLSNLESDHKNPNMCFRLHSDLYLRPHLTLICSAVYLGAGWTWWDASPSSCHAALWEQYTHMFLRCRSHTVHKAHSLICRILRSVHTETK